MGGYKQRDLIQGQDPPLPPGTAEWGPLSDVGNRHQGRKAGRQLSQLGVLGCASLPGTGN